MDPTRPGTGGEAFAHLHHDLMNPLTVVVGYAQMLADRPDLDEEARSQARRILEEARECVRIVERARAAVHAARRAEAAPAAVAVATGGAKKRVMIVDDEQVILRLTAEILHAEFDVTTCDNANEALRKLLIDEYDLVLLDLNLGGRIGGRELYDTLLVQQPEVADRVVFVTGGIVSDDEQDFITSSGRECIQKPFHINALREAVRRLTA
ncbi:MAG: response regulator [Deltaproteobacteria bacterium]|nr:response regulator [Deltaproteobacteria bacterium]